MEVLVAQLCPTCCDPTAFQVPLFMKFSRRKGWSGEPFPSPGGHPDAGIEPRPPAPQGDSLPLELIKYQNHNSKKYKTIKLHFDNEL